VIHIEIHFMFPECVNMLHVFCLTHLDLSPGHRRVHWILPKSEGKSNAKSVGCLRHFCTLILFDILCTFCHPVSQLCRSLSHCVTPDMCQRSAKFQMFKEKLPKLTSDFSGPKTQNEHQLCCMFIPFCQMFEACWNMFANMLNHVLHTVPRLGRSLEGLEVPTVAVVCSNYYSNLDCTWWANGNKEPMDCHVKASDENTIFGSL
jgi:hypothetical protein